jgi:polar amino acid transport system substrate-binding protein
VSATAPGARARAVRRAGVAVLAVAAVGAAAACARTEVPEALPGPTTATTAAAAPPPETPGCDPETVTRSLRPDAAARTATATATGDVPAGSHMATIRERGRLRVAVDTSTMLFSIVDPRDGEFRGFDVEMAEEVASALFGEANDETLELVAVPKSERVDVLLGEGAVDLVADSFTITCARDAEIDFSTVYFEAAQRLLVREDDASTSIAEFAARGGRACAPLGSTSVDNMRALPDPPEIIEAGSQGECLVLLQQGRADGISTDDTILAGMVAQDPTLVVVGGPLSREPYGLGLPPDRPEWVRYVNAVLEQVRDSGRWDELYDVWFRDHLGEDREPPVPEYED